MLGFRVGICFVMQKMDILWWDFRRFRKSEKCDCQLHVCLSVRPQRTIRLPLNGLSLRLTFD